MNREQFLEIDRVKQTFISQRRRGEGTIETAFAEYDGRYQKLMLTSLIAAELYELRRQGVEPELEEYVTRFPHFGPYVRLAFGRPTIPHLFPPHWIDTFI